MLSKEIVSKSFDSRKNPFLAKEKVFLSNQMDILLHHLIEGIYTSRNPSSFRQIVIIPSNATKDFLIQQITDRVGCLFGIRFLTLPQAIEHFIKLSYEGPLLFPSLVACMLFLETTLKGVVDSKEEALYPLLDYLQGDEEKIRSLAEELSHVFLQYGIYGGSALKEWEEKPHWQQILWRRAKNLFHFPCHILASPPTPKIDLKVHLFNLTVIPPIYQNFLEKLSTYWEIDYYFLSPTPHYWGDTLSEKAIAFLDQTFQAKKISKAERFSFEKMTSDTNFLLGNLGQVAKPLYQWLIEKETSENFYVKEASSSLTSLQQEVYELCPATKKEKDDSIQLHEAPSMLREVEILLHNLQDIVAKGIANIDEVIVYVVDLEAYFPFIEFVFEKSSSPFGYRITDLKLEKQSAYIESVKEFFAFAEGRFEGESLIKLITREGFAYNRFFAEEELPLLREIIDGEKIRFGYDKANREEILEEIGLSERGSWKFAFDTLLDDLPTLSSRIDLSNAEAFGRIMEFVSTLHFDLEKLRKGEKTLEEWILLLTELVEKYFSFEEETKALLNGFNRLHNLIPLLTGTFAYKTIRKILEEIFQSKATSAQLFLKPMVHFCSLNEGSIVESKVLYLMGMDEHSFPRQSKIRSINLLRGKPGSDKQAESAEKDRYLLLQALLSATKRLIISYTGLSPQDGKPITSSLLLQEILTLFPNNFIEKHPPFPFSKYYTEKTHYSEENERLAKAYYGKERGEAIPFTPLPPSIPSTVSIKELGLLFRHPIQFYCNTLLGVYLEKDSLEKQEEASEFFLSYLDRAVIPFDLVTKQTTSSHLPTALFEKTAEKEIEGEVEQMEKNFKALGITPSDLFSVHFDPAAKEPAQIKDNLFIHPPLTLTLQGQTIVVYGQLNRITPKGILSFGENSTKEMWKNLPYLLLLANTSFPFSPDILFLKSGTTATLRWPDPKLALQNLVTYFLEARHFPSPLMPDRIDPLLKKTKTLDAKSFETSFPLFEDPYLSFLSPDWTQNWACHLPLFPSP